MASEAPPAPARGDRLARLLLGACSVLLAALVLLSAYLVRTRARTRRLQAELAQKVEVQRRTMEQLPSDQCLYPHFKNSIGYVLNPFMQSGTLWAPRDHPYAISPLGLRGPNCAAAIAGHTRIVLLGDSWFFGWMLADEDRLDAQLRALLKDPRYEVLIAAIPGWNVSSEAAYLESHIRHLDPDVVVWQTCPNDTWDVGGVIPPGQLSYRMSPQNPDPEENAFTQLGAATPGLPAVLGRWVRNLRRMDAVRTRFGVPVLVAPVDIPPALWRLVAQKSGVQLPAAFIPAAYQADPRSRISDHDSHPTAWMNRRLAVGYASRLAQMGLIHDLALDAEEQALAEPWRQANASPATDDDVDAYLRRQAAALPAAYPQEADFGRVAAGMVEDDLMGRHGLLHLRVPPGAGAVTLELDAGPYAEKFTRELEVEARNFEGRSVKVRRTFSGQAQRVTCELALPRAPSRYPAWELEWRFNYDECDYPTRCYAARPVRVSSH